jgi:CRP-like cAMP-binding protein
MNWQVKWPGSQRSNQRFNFQINYRVETRIQLHSGVAAPSAERPAEVRANDLLAALGPADWQRWEPRLQRVVLPLGYELYSAGCVPTHAYFLVTAIASLQYLSASGESSGISVVGHEGVVGVPLFMGGGSTPSRAVVHRAGIGWRLPGPMLQAEFEGHPHVQSILLRYTQALIAQMAQTAVCNRHHQVDQQLSRWLLLNLDRMQGDELLVTQELMARMLGVRREGVTEAARRLQRLGVIRYARGRIQVLDRPGLERCSCECYAVVKREYDRLAPR